MTRHECRPLTCLQSQVSLAYDVDVSDDGMLGAGAYGTVLAAVHRSTGRQVRLRRRKRVEVFSLPSAVSIAWGSAKDHSSDTGSPPSSSGMQKSS